MALLPHPARSFLKHLLQAGNRHDVHSPFVYSLVDNALRTTTPPKETADIEHLRNALLANMDLVSVTDLGAGSRIASSTQRRIRDIARTALKPRRQAEQLARIARYFRPRTMLELGTSLGITALHLSRAVPEARLHTVEGCPQIGAVAQGNFRKLGAGNISLHIGAFKDQLPRVLSGITQLDFAYIDGHHAKEPTLAYFEQCLAKAHNESVFVFDDIHWSEGMEEAWAALCEHPKVTVTIDLFHFGLVFLRREQQKEHFRLRY